MRILHVVTLISPDGAYGGPARVAINQASELARRGHDLTIAAATRGYNQPPTKHGGVRLRLFPTRRMVPGTRFAGLSAPGLFWWLWHSSGEFDIVHVHLGRDLVTLPAALVARRRAIPYVVQTHGMIGPSEHPLAPLLDRVCTRRVFRDAGSVLYLNDGEKRQLSTVARGGLRFTELANGVPQYPTRAAGHAGPPEVLFAARLQARKQPTVFVGLAHALLGEGVDALFTLVGPDEGEGDAVRNAISGEPRIRWTGPLHPDAIPARLAEADIFVLPAVREPYPMGVLEAMSVGLPVVVADDCGLAETIAKTRSGIVARADVSGMTTAVRTLLADPACARRMGDQGRETVARAFGMSAVAETLLQTYQRIRGIRV